VFPRGAVVAYASHALPTRAIAMMNIVTSAREDFWSRAPKTSSDPFRPGCRLHPRFVPSHANRISRVASSVVDLRVVRPREAIRWGNQHDDSPIRCLYWTNRRLRSG
jgi:hypothetical protein